MSIEFYFPVYMEEPGRAVVFEAEIFFSDKYGDDAGVVTSRLFLAKKDAQSWLETKMGEVGKGRPWILDSDQDPICDLGDDEQYSALVREVQVY